MPYRVPMHNYSATCTANQSCSAASNTGNSNPAGRSSRAAGSMQQRAASTPPTSEELVLRCWVPLRAPAPPHASAYLTCYDQHTSTQQWSCSRPARVARPHRVTAHRPVPYASVRSTVTGMAPRWPAPVLGQGCTQRSNRAGTCPAPGLQRAWRTPVEGRTRRRCP